MATPAVTVLMPVRNGAAYLQEAIDSMLGQTLPDFEFLIVDDGSTDETPALLRGAARRDSRIRVLTLGTARGITGALNAGAAEARAALIARMDADDRSRPERLELQVAALTRSPQVVAVGSQIETFGLAQRQLTYPSSEAEARAYLLFACPFKHPSVLMRRGALRQVGGYPARRFPSEDYALWVRLSTVGGLFNLPQTLLEYRLHPHSVMASRASAVRRHTRLAQADALALLGLAPSARERTAHEALGRAAFDPVRVSRAVCQDAVGWLGTLQAANRRKRWVAADRLAFECQRRLANLIPVPD